MLQFWSLIKQCVCGGVTGGVLNQSPHTSPAVETSAVVLPGSTFEAAGFFKTFQLQNKANGNRSKDLQCSSRPFFQVWWGRCCCPRLSVSLWRQRRGRVTFQTQRTCLLRDCTLMADSTHKLGNHHGEAFLIFGLQDLKRSSYKLNMKLT